MQNQTLTIKITTGDELRRATIVSPASYGQLRVQLKNLFGVEETERLRFKDEEGDMITLASDSDYSEALRVVGATANGILRLSVGGGSDERKGKGGSSVGRKGPALMRAHGRRCGRFSEAAAETTAPPQAECPGANAQCGGAGGFAPLMGMVGQHLPELLARVQSNPMLSGIAEQLMSNGLVKVVQPFVCDVCNTEIEGDRFHSTTAADFDVCQKCHSAELEATHKFERVTPLQALIATLSNGGSVDAEWRRGPGPCVPQLARHCALCDVCNEGIVGVRHKCLDCADYDECSKCRTASPHTAEHVFYAIVDTQQRTVPEAVRAVHEARKAEVKKATPEPATAPAPVVTPAPAPVVTPAPAPAPVAAPTPVQEAPKVVEEAPKVEAPKVEAPKVEGRKLSEFELNMQTLESMGFMERDRNIQALVRNRGRLFEAIQELLGGQ